jgi:ribosomal protein S12 methylthiotransferase
MKASIVNLHNMCENNTLQLTRLSRYLDLNGLQVVDISLGPDLILVGGCVVTDTMRQRCEQTVLGLLQQHQAAQVVIFGCQAAFDEGLASAAGDATRRLHFIPYRQSRLMDSLLRAELPFADVTANRLAGHFPYQPRMGAADNYVLISQGCSNQCSYCNIKKAKGGLVSRSPSDIEAEVTALAAEGVDTVTLLADDCGSYGHDLGSDLACLLDRLAAAAPSVRFKLFTVFPALFLDLYPRLAHLVADGRIPYVCVPVQSAVPRLLRLMNRDYAPDLLAETIAVMRQSNPHMFVYTHFIFDFPTETWDEFLRSVDYARHFDHAAFIGYGRNEGTVAAAIAGGDDRQMRDRKAGYLQESVDRRGLAAFIVPCP